VTKPVSKQEAALAALREGLPVEVAAERAGVSASTVRTWVRKGRRDPDGEFGAFVIEPTMAEGTMSAAELETHLVEVIRSKKSVAAMALWTKLHPRDQVLEDDPFAEFDPGYRQ
jgi:hypothetical protein